MVDKSTDGPKPADGISDAVRAAALAQLAKLSGAGVQFEGAPASPAGSEFGEAARALEAATQYQPGSPMQQQAANQNEQPAEVLSISEAVEEQERASARDAASQLLDELESLDGEAKSRMPGYAGLKSVLEAAAKSGTRASFNRDEVRKAIETAVAQASGAKAETPQEKVDRLWGEIDKNNKEITKTFEKLHEEGYIDDDTLKEYIGQRAHIDSIKDPQARIAAERAFQDKFQRPQLEKALQRAKSEGKDELVKDIENSIELLRKNEAKLLEQQQHLKQKPEIPVDTPSVQETSNPSAILPSSKTMEVVLPNTNQLAVTEANLPDGPNVSANTSQRRQRGPIDTSNPR